MTYQQKIGKLGEEIGTNYLIKHKYQIFAKNYYTKYGEIDIIAKKNDLLIFIEVKTRTNNKFGDGKENILRNKDNFMKTTMQFLNNNQAQLNEINHLRFDALIIMLNKTRYKVEHLKNIFS